MTWIDMSIGWVGVQACVPEGLPSVVQIAPQKLLRLEPGCCIDHDRAYRLTRTICVVDGDEWWKNNAERKPDAILKMHEVTGSRFVVLICKRMSPGSFSHVYAANMRIHVNETCRDKNGFAVIRFSVTKDMGRTTPYKFYHHLA